MSQRSIITLLHNDTPILTDLRQEITKLIQSENLTAKIMKDNEWTLDEFDDVDWMSYHTSLHKIPRAHRVSITKLSQRLWNTNMQTTNTIHSAMCPACQRNNETIGHVYSCKEPTVLKVRETALALFTDRQPVQSGTTTTPGGDINRYQTLCVSSPNY